VMSCTDADLDRLETALVARRTQVVEVHGWQVQRGTGVIIYDVELRDGTRRKDHTRPDLPMERFPGRRELEHLLVQSRFAGRS
jgi:hypothetical protein